MSLVLSVLIEPNLLLWIDVEYSLDPSRDAERSLNVQKVQKAVAPCPRTSVVAVSAG